MFKNNNISRLGAVMLQEMKPKFYGKLISRCTWKMRQRDLCRSGNL